MCEVNENELNQVEEMEEEYIGSEEQMGLIAVDEELKRIKIQESPTSEISEETKNSKFYKESMIAMETVGSAFQKLLGYGIDYNNALALANNLVTNDVNVKIANVQQVNQEQNNI